MADQLIALRNRLRLAGFMPIPVEGKRPPMQQWQKHTETNPSEIALWCKSFPRATNTGILTQLAPVLDVDITDPDAAEAVERLARDRFGDCGRLLVRIGQTPKRAIPFRTDKTFKKITVNLIAGNGADQKLELLADGQQVVVAGIHPATGQPYRWHGGEPGEVRRADLPALSEDEARALVEDAAELLVREHGYQLAPTRPGKRRQAKAGNGAPDPGGAADWGYLTESIRAGRDLHDSLRDLAAKLVASGMSPGAVVNHMRGLLEGSTAPHDDHRWRDRYAEIPGLVDGAVAKFRRPEEKPPVAPSTIDEVHKVFKRWLGAEYDFATLDAMLAVAASERLPGDPAWLLIVSGSGNAKTETVQATSGLGAHVVSTIASDGALLSATSRKQRSKDATGGLLRSIGERGILAIKDVTSILSMDRHIRGTLLAALREIHDGQWTRNVGIDGGKTLSWKGRVVVIGACTTAWDQAHAVISNLGDRFVLVRSDSHLGRIAGGRRAVHNTGDEVIMRQELADAVAGLINTIDATNVYLLTEDDEDRIVRAADLATLARSAVEQDYRGNIIDAHAPEMPTRLAKQLTQIMRGAVAIGMPHDNALRLVLRCAQDSMPQLRLAVLRDVAAHPDSPVIDIRRRLQKPRLTIDRTLEALQMLGLLSCREEERERAGKLVHVRFYRLADAISLDPISVSGNVGVDTENHPNLF